MSIGVGILSTDREDSLCRLLQSIYVNSDMNMDVIVSDDSSKSKSKIKSLVDSFGYKYIDSGTRIGVAKNTNILMNALEDYDIKFILNNDIEILKYGWMDIYVQGIERTGIHHFCFRQLGLWGACKEGENSKRPDSRIVFDNIEIATIPCEAQGAMLVYDKLVHDTVGYFDSERFISYGKAHEDWSMRVSESGIQALSGIHDIGNSNEYITVHDEISCTPSKERVDRYKINTDIFKQKRKDIAEGRESVYVKWKK